MSVCLAQGDHGALQSCSVPAAAGAWLLEAQSWASAMQQQRAGRELGSFCLYKACEKCKFSEGRVTLNSGDVLGRTFICNGNAKPLLQHRGSWRRLIREAPKEAVNIYSGLRSVHFILALLLEMDELV